MRGHRRAALKRIRIDTKKKSPDVVLQEAELTAQGGKGGAEEEKAGEVQEKVLLPKPARSSQQEEEVQVAVREKPKKKRPKINTTCQVRHF